MSTAVAPSKEQKENINYSIADSSLGRLLVAATERGICALSLGDSDQTLESELRKDYPKAQIHRDSARLEGWVVSIVNHLKDPSLSLHLPLDIQGTTFQWQVWRQLQSIPSGETRSYAEISQKLGRPGTARAVGRACASNRVAVVIPCHRAVREDGQLGGYRWGLERKEALLAREKESIR